MSYLIDIEHVIDFLTNIFAALLLEPPKKNMNLMHNNIMLLIKHNLRRELDTACLQACHIMLFYAGILVNLFFTSQSAFRKN